MGILIRQAGILTTVQDGGRFGSQQSGVSVTGVADLRAYQIGNALVGNTSGEACLEATMAGLELEFTCANTFAVTGGDMAPTLNGEPVPMYSAMAAQEGDVLRLSAYKSGFRCYIIFAGGLDVPVVFGSRSTHLRCAFGGLEGRKLALGDRIPFLKPSMQCRTGARVLQEQYDQSEIVLRVVLGPQEDYFSEEGIQTFLSSEYTATQEMDRLGARLSGPVIKHAREAGIISDGVTFGSVQVPANGQPMIMLADRQSTGGYTKIATVISVDIPQLAQATPGTKIRFQQVSVEQAQELYIEQYRKIREMEERMGSETIPLMDLRLEVHADANVYQVRVSELPQ